MSRSISPSAAGPFASGRRGGMSQWETGEAYRLKSLGRSNQFIANTLGRSMYDISLLFQSAPERIVEATGASPVVRTRPKPPTIEEKQERFREMWLSGRYLHLIEQDLGITRTTITRWRRALRLPMRREPRA